MVLLTKWGIMLEAARTLFQNKKYKKCFLELIKVSRTMSNETEYLEMLYQVQMQLQDSNAAVKTLAVLIKKLQCPQHCLLQMSLLMSLNRHNEALDIGLFLQNRTLTQVEKKQLFNYLIDIYIVFNDFEGLEEVLMQYQSDFTSDATSLFAWGLLYIHNDQPQDAILCLRQAVYANPQLDRAWVSLAIMHNKMGDHELALANIEKALDINDQNPVAIKCYALWKEQQGEYNQASKKISTYLQRNSFDFDLTQKSIDLLHKLNQPILAYVEEVKLRYYFGQI